MEKQLYSIASDYLRGAMLQFAMRKAADLAGESFYHGLGIESLGSDDVLIFAEDAWGRYSLTIDFDYPHYAHRLFLRAFQTAYLAYHQRIAEWCASQVCRTWSPSSKRRWALHSNDLTSPACRREPGQYPAAPLSHRLRCERWRETRCYAGPPSCGSCCPS